MKFLGTLFTLASLTASTAFATLINVSDSVFKYTINTNTKTGYIRGLRNTNAQSVTIKPYITYNSVRYTINQIAANAFTDVWTQEIIIPSTVQSMKFLNNAFKGAKDIRKVELNSLKVTANINAFNGIDKNVYFQGEGTKNFINDYCKVLLRYWGLPVGKDYTNVSADVFNKALYDLAVKVKQNFVLDDKVAYRNSVGSVLALKAGGREGLARTYRILARNMGFQYNDVHVGGDGGRYDWNYVYIIKNANYKRWFNLDIPDTDFSASYNANVFKTKTQMKNLIQSNVDPSKWIIYNDEYNYPGEYILVNGQKYYFDPKYEEFYSYLVRNRAGSQA